MISQGCRNPAEYDHRIIVGDFSAAESDDVIVLQVENDGPAPGQYPYHYIFYSEGGTEPFVNLGLSSQGAWDSARALKVGGSDELYFLAALPLRLSI